MDTSKMDSSETPQGADERAASAEQARAEREEANSKTGVHKLPAELRNRVYLDLVQSASKVVFQNGRALDIHKGDLGVLRICRLIRKEVSPIFFHNARLTFVVDSTEQYCEAKSFLLSLPQEAVASLQKVYFTSRSSTVCGHSQWGRLLNSTDVMIDQQEHQEATYSNERARYGHVLCHICQVCPRKSKRDMQEELHANAARLNTKLKEEELRTADLLEFLDLMRQIHGCKES